MKKFTSLCQALKQKHTKENWFFFFCLTVYRVEPLSSYKPFKSLAAMTALRCVLKYNNND